MKTISPSQIKLWMSCQRAWGYAYLEGKRSPSTDSQALGTRVHAILEAWLAKGTIPDPDEVFETSRGLKYPGAIARAGLPLLPTPGDHIEVEKEFHVEAAPGVLLHGLVDLMALGIVGDHKTTTDFKWALKPQDLLDDYQAIIYGFFYFTTHKSSDTVELTWIYYRTTKSPEAIKVSIKVTREETERKIHEIILPIAREILGATSVDQLKQNPKHCSAYGGCPHREYCKVSAKERFFSDMNISTFLEAQKAQSPVSVPEAPAVPEAPEVPEAPAVPEITETSLPEAPAYDPEDLRTWTRDQLKTRAVDLGLVDSGCRFREDRLREVLSAPASVVSTVPVYPDHTPDVAVPDFVGACEKGFGNTFAHIAAPQEVPDLPINVLPPVPGHQGTCTIGTDDTPMTIGTLYVDCVPIGEDCLHLSKVIADALETLGFEEDYRLDPDSSFGKAAGVLSDAVAAELAEYHDGIDVICSTRTPEHQHCLAMLEGRAARIVRGL